VRVELTIPESRVNLIRETEIMKALDEAHQRHLQRNIQRDTRTRLGNISAEGLAPSEALSLYLKTRHLSEAEEIALLAEGQRLIDKAAMGDRSSV
jgi:hypothetical protein